MLRCYSCRAAYRFGRKHWKSVLVLVVWTLWVFLIGAQSNQQYDCNPNTKDGAALFCLFKIGVDGLRGGIGDWIARNKEVIEALSTVAVAVFTYTLWRSTSGLKESTDRLWTAGERQIKVGRQQTFAAIHAAKSSRKASSAARDNAEAALDQVKSFTNKERAYLVPSTFSGSLKGPEEGATEWRAWIAYNWVNIGATAARIHEMRCKIFSGPPNLRSKPDFSGSAETVHHGYLVVGPSMPVDGAGFTLLHIDQAMCDALWKDSVVLYAIGSVTYKTVFDAMVTRVFTMKYKIDSSTWSPTQGGFEDETVLNFEVKDYYTKESVAAFVSSGSSSGTSLINAEGRKKD